MGPVLIFFHHVPGSWPRVRRSSLCGPCSAPWEWLDGCVFTSRPRLGTTIAYQISIFEVRTRNSDVTRPSFKKRRPQPVFCCWFAVPLSSRLSDINRERLIRPFDRSWFVKFFAIQCNVSSTSITNRSCSGELTNIHCF